MSSPTNKEQFLKQFDSIVRGIVDNKERVGQPSLCFPALATGFMFSRAYDAWFHLSAASSDWFPPFIAFVICLL